MIGKYVGKRLVAGSKSLSRRSIYPFLEKYLREIPSGSRVLNVGSGGEFAAFVDRAAAAADFEVVSSDIDPARAPDVVDDICASNLTPGSFDAVLLLSVLEHVRAPHEAAREIDRLLRPGGIALVQVPFLFPIHDRPHDYYRFTEYGMRHLFSHMEITDLQPCDNWLEALLVQASRTALEPKSKAGFTKFLVAPLAIMLFPIASWLGGRNDFITSGYVMKVVKRAVA